MSQKGILCYTSISDKYFSIKQAKHLSSLLQNYLTQAYKNIMIVKKKELYETCKMRESSTPCNIDWQATQRKGSNKTMAILLSCIQIKAYWH